MSSCALRHLVNVFGCNRSSIQVPLFLVPKILENTSKTISNFRTQSSRCSREPSSATAASKPRYNDEKWYLRSKTRHTNSGLAKSPCREYPSAWIKLLEPFLPPELRNNVDDLDGDRINNSSKQLVRLLREAWLNTPFEIDLLCYLGVHQGRWKAVLWLIKKISHPRRHCLSSSNQLDKICASQWASVSASLKQISSRPIWAEDLVQPIDNVNLKLDTLTKPSKSDDCSRVEPKLYHEGIGQIWQSAGHMVLQAADLRQTDSKYQIILSHVFQILAHMHHVNAFPELIYKHNPSNDPFVPTRPPTLNILSSQIMAILSDSVWRADNNAFLQSDTDDIYNKHNLSRAFLKANELSVGVWLDLLLWVCLDGGWLSEAAWIINEIDKRKERPDQRWSVTTWNAILKPVVPRSTWSARLGDSIAKSRINEVPGGAAISNQNGTMVFRDIAPRSISREVVLAIIDGLISSTLTMTKLDNELDPIVRNISICKRLLSTDCCGVDPNLLNTIMLRLIDSEFSNTINSSEIENIMQLSQTSGSEKLAPVSLNSPTNLPSDIIMPNSSFSLGLLHLMLFCFLKTDDLQGTLLTYRRLQQLRDVESQELIQDFMGKIQQPSLDPSDVSASTKSEAQTITPIYQSPIPNYTLAAFLDFATRLENWEMAWWMIHSSDADGPMISSDLYSEPSLQPALIHFAMATSDTQLLARVIEKLKTPLSQPHLKALLHYQIKAANWNSVEDLLSYLRDKPGMRWDEFDAMEIAIAVLYAERGVSKGDSSSALSLSPALTILQGIFSGEYNSTRRLSKDQHTKQALLVDQLGRILMNVPGKLSTLILPHSTRDRRVNPRVDIPADAFNILLKGVVDCKGSMAGKELWDRWCKNYKRKTNNHPGVSSYITEPEQVVDPNLQSIRIIIQPLVKASEVPGRIENPADRSLLKWGVQMYQDFGFSIDQIKAEIPKQLIQT